jgi:polynucleotide 5'-hydroxyl-kinase GRC3/NOL9
MITVCGSMLLSVAKGIILVFGTELSATTPPAFYPIYAPLSHSLPVIIALKHKKSKTSKDPEAIIYLKNYRSGIELFPEICQFTETLFKPPTTCVTIAPEDPTFHIVFNCPTPIARTIYPLSWKEAIQTTTISPTSRILVCGSKGLGKSTFCQLLINSLIGTKMVTYLETDPGQPSFSPPGVVSLHCLTNPILSPPFVRAGMNDLIRCQHIGNISPRDNPRHYTNCITDLLSHDPRNGPLVINTPGWTKGTGFELLTFLIEIAKPDFIVVLSIAGNDSLARNLHPIASKSESNILLIDSANTVPPTLALTAADHRTLGIMSYFHNIALEKWDFTKHLTGWKPWVVKYSGSSEERGLMAIAIQGEELLLEDIVLAINGTMVAIILTTSDESVSTTPEENIPVIVDRQSKFMDPRISRCVGYALIRGIDVKNECLLLLSPWKPSGREDGEKIILERGHVNLPVWGMWDHKNPRTLGPWLQKR